MENSNEKILCHPGSNRLYSDLIVCHSWGESQRPLVNTIQMTGPIDPATAIYVHRSIEAAEANQASALVILMDTPGGLLDSTKSIVKDFYDSTVPIVVYVYPQTARAASAGAIITLAANVPAMSPSTR